jgi:hypothetical protein
MEKNEDNKLQLLIFVFDPLDLWYEIEKKANAHRVTACVGRGGGREPAPQVDWRSQAPRFDPG